MSELRYLFIQGALNAPPAVPCPPRWRAAARWIILIIQEVAISRGHLFFALERRLDNSIKRRTGEQ